jgi:hypothetical protein
VVCHARPLTGGQKLARTFDQDLCCSARRRRVAGIHDDGTPRQCGCQPLARDEVNRVLRAAPAQDPNLMTALS